MFRPILTGFISVLVLPGPVVAAPKGAPGATATELIALARQLNPEVAAAALTAEAATARIASAAALPDPNFRVTGDNLAQRNLSMNRIPTIYSLIQQCPLCAKLRLKPH